MSIVGEPGPGETVRVNAATGEFLAWGAYSPASQIAVRVWARDKAQAITPAFIEDRLSRAFQMRGFLSSPDAHGAARLVNAESDGLPGLVIDCYAGFAVCQFLSAGAERWKTAVIDSLQSGRVGAFAGGYERSDVDVREKEGLPPRAGPLFGAEPPPEIEIDEGGLRFLVDVRQGHKTGFYLDQRHNRAVVQGLAAGREVLNAFSYTGAFAIAALKGGAARVTNIDSSAGALALARRHVTLNGFADEQCEHIEGDVFAELRRLRDSRREFDLIILDPPKLAHSAGQVERASRAYKDINLLALKLLRAGGLLVTFSCSGAVSADLFQKIVHGAALDAGRDAQIIDRLTQAADHPVLLTFPEAEYLKGLVLRVV